MPSPLNPNKGVIIRELQTVTAPFQSKEVDAHVKRNRPEGPEMTGNVAKKQKAWTPTNSIVQQMYAKMGHHNASEAEVQDWVNADVDASIDVTTNLCAELIMRQASHAKELKKLSRDNKILRFKLTRAESDMKKLSTSHEMKLKQDTEQFWKELFEEREKVKNVEKARDDAVEAARFGKECSDQAITNLNTKLEASPFDKTELETE
ncbi:uncharacterized protein LOC141670549 isoform X2 [Apium graveolens]